MLWTMDNLTFNDLAAANDARAAEWNATGTPIPAEFAIIELFGECGELANAWKKMERHHLGMAGGVDNTENFEEELGDVVICASLVARKYGIDLGAAVRSKFNKTSEKHGFGTRL